jgi:hypothetical protein
MSIINNRIKKLEESIKRKQGIGFEIIIRASDQEATDKAQRRTLKDDQRVIYLPREIISKYGLEVEDFPTI